MSGVNTVGKQPKISVIITTYNSEDTIERCLLSLVNQTIKDLEIIIVDDGSTDLTLTIINGYLDRYSLISLFVNEINKGPGYAKNKGLASAKGEFVGFLDSDDYLDDDYYELLYKAASHYDTGIACSDLALEYPSKMISCDLITGNIYNDLHKKELKLRKGANIIPSIYAASHWTAASACTKIFKRSLLNGYQFYEGRCCDDLLFSLPLMASVNKIAYVKGLYYHYVQREGSTEYRNFDKTRLDAVTSISLTFERLQQIDNSEENIKLLVMNSGIETFKKLLFTTTSKDQLVFIKDFYSRISPQLLEYFSVHNNEYIRHLLDIYYQFGERVFLESSLDLLARGECEMIHEIYNKWISEPQEFYPKVSIVIPVYNGSNYMREAIGSALTQTYPNIEVIVVNDGSNDNGMTDRIARSYGDRIRYFKKENGGVATALNLGIEKMEGEYFAWLSHDDIYDNDKIANEMEILSKLKDRTTFIAGGYTLVTKTGERLYDINLTNLYDQEELSRPLFAVFRGGINGCATLIHKSHFERVGMFNPSLPTTQDYDMWFRILRGQKLYYYNGSFVKSRTHEEQGSRQSINSHVVECNELWIRMMSSLTDEERTAIDGTPYLFYLNTVKFLESATAYNEAISYAKQQALEIAVDNYYIKDTNIHKKYEILNTINLAIDKGLKLTDYKDFIDAPSTKKRVFFLLGDLSDGGGLTRVTLNVANSLTNLYDVYIIADNSKRRHASGISKEIKIIDVSLYNYTPELLGAIPIIFRADVFVMGFNCQQALLPIYSLVRKAGIKTIAWNHEFYFMPYFYSHLCHSVQIKNIEHSNADAVVWSNSFSANVYGLYHNNGIVIPNPLTLDKPKKVDRQRKNVIISVGRFDDPVKNLESLLISFSKVKNRCPDSELYVIGSYDMKQQIPDMPEYTYQKLIKELDIPADSLHFTGWVNDTSVYYKKAKMQLFTSNFEGFGLVLTEAAAYGVPSIVFDGSGFEDIITDGENGYIVQRGQTDHMAEKAIELIDSQDKWMQMSLAAEKMSERYTMDNITDKWRGLVGAVINKDSGELKEYLNQDFLDSQNNIYAFAKQMALHYENCIDKIMRDHSINSSNVQGVVVNENINYSSDFYKNEYDKMLNTLSWRITKPLRLVRIAQNYCRANGFKATIKRILEKMKKK